MPRYTTRSAIDCECPRKRYWNYFHNGTGITPVGEYLPFVAGGAVHSGIEAAGNKHFHLDEITTKEFSYRAKPFFRDVEEAEQDYAYQEQLALSQALVLAWEAREWPQILANYEIEGTEREFQVPLDPNGDLILLTRPDKILRGKQDGELYVYSVKTIRSWYERLEKSYRVDLQGFTEAIGATIGLKQKILGTKFCYLLKGRRAKEVEQVMDAGNIVEVEHWITKSPLIYGYRSYKDGKIRYAHSDKIVKLENKSGFGKLPSSEGWERFPVWETKRGIKKWIEMLPKIQPELGDVLKGSVITPVEVHRTKEQLKDTLVQIKASEKKVFEAADAVANGASLAENFPMNRRACYWPTECEYLQICNNGNEEYDPAIAADPVGSGEFMARIAHYETERMALANG